MTLQDLEALDDDMLLPKDVASVLGCAQYAINVQAQRDPTALGFPVIVTGTRVRIPREGFLFYMKHGRPIITQR